MAEMVKSAIVGEGVSWIFSGIAAASKTEDKPDVEATGGGSLERLEMARIKMEAALQTSDKWQITDTSLLHWRKKLKRAAQDCDDAARRCRQLSRQEDEAEKAEFISSYVVRNNDHCHAGFETAAAVRRFEKYAEGAGEFIRYVQLGGTPRQHLFFDPLIGHIFAGKTVLYQVLQSGGRYYYLSIQAVGSEERGLEALLSFMYEDCKVPKKSFLLGVMLRISESTNIIGTVVKCLQVMTPHFKSSADFVIKEIIHLPTQDFSYVTGNDPWIHIHEMLTTWFRRDPLCCQGYEHDLVHSCHSSSDSSNGRGNKLRFSSIFPEPVCGVFLLRQISLFEYNKPPGSTVVAGHDHTSSLDNSLPLKLGILFLPHDSSEDPMSTGSVIEVIDRENQHHLTHINVHSDQLDEMLLPKAIDFLHRSSEAMTYQVCWRSNHGSAHLCVEKIKAEIMLGARRGKRQGRNIKSTKVLRHLQQDQRMWLRKQVAGAFQKLWVVRSSERLQSWFTTWQCSGYP
ncbi:hypothetical protein VPH35_055749 [Triticum aestivum]